MVGNATETAFERSPERIRFECSVTHEELGDGRISVFKSEDGKISFKNADLVENLYADLPVVLAQFS